MPSLDERIAAAEKKQREAQAALRKLREDKRKREREERREAQRRERERVQREAVQLWNKLHETTLRLNDGETVNAYDFVTSRVLTRAVVERSDTPSDADTTGAASVE